MNILVINAGSSSLKYQFIKIEEEKVLAKGLCERIGIEGSKLTLKVPGKDDYVVEKHMDDHSVAISMVIDALTDKEHGVIADMKEIDAVGHRVVHGGEIFACSVVIDEKVKEALHVCSDLAPLHNPANIIGIEACEKAMPGVPQVGVFDTAFHQTMPKKAYMYALPYELYTKHKIRRYGFHGTSHRFVSERAAAMLGKPLEELKIITCHLGNGSSIAAVDCGKSVDTSMGFTPLAGVPMGTRSGDIDPAIVTFLMEKENLSAKEVNDLMNKQSGVFGISELSSDFRDLEGSKDTNEKSALALEMFAYGVTKYIGAYAAAMGGVDAIVFTAGVGENTALTRGQIVEKLGFMGIKIDPELNKIRGEEKDISAPDATVRTLVIPTNEELMIAKDTAMLVK
ncbi:MAG: acetate kinase [Clostridia bacterium]|nr:acetate kinase [Clostridia bacterium]MBQ4630859.1 acetate kinase [Clostridia bacterium]